MANTNLRAKGERLEALVEELHEHAEPRSKQLADELLGLVTDLYGAALARVVELAKQMSPTFVDVLAADELVRSLLLVHGLHPESLQDRLESALERARPLLASHGGGVELLDVDAAAGAVRLRLLGSCDGCPASAVTLRSAVERAIVEEAPEIVTIDVEEPAPGAQPDRVALVVGHRKALTTNPAYTECPSELAGL